MTYAHPGAPGRDECEYKHQGHRPQEKAGIDVKQSSVICRVDKRCTNPLTGIRRKPGAYEQNGDDDTAEFGNQCCEGNSVYRHAEQQDENEVEHDIRQVDDEHDNERPASILHADEPAYQHKIDE